MSRTAWNILGILTILTGISVLSWMPEQLAALPPDQRPKYIAGMALLGGLLGVIASTCFFPKVRPVSLRILGAISIMGCIFTLVDGWHRHDFSQFPIILVFWLPGSIYLVIKGKMTDELPGEK